jgi:hypothetical protein
MEMRSVQVLPVVFLFGIIEDGNDCTTRFITCWESTQVLTCQFFSSLAFHHIRIAFLCVLTGYIYLLWSTIGPYFLVFPFVIRDGLSVFRLERSMKSPKVTNFNLLIGRALIDISFTVLSWLLLSPVQLIRSTLGRLHNPRVQIFSTHSNVRLGL